MCAAAKVAQIKVTKEECTKGTGARVKTFTIEGCTNTVIKGGLCRRHGAKLKLCTQIKLGMVGCAEDMGQKPSYAVGRVHKSSCEWWGVQKARSDASDIVQQQRRLHE